MRDIKIKDSILISIQLTNLITFLSNFNYLSILKRPKTSVLFKLADLLKPKLFLSSLSTFISQTWSILLLQYPD